MEFLHLLNRRSDSLKTFVDILNKNHKMPSVPKDNRKNMLFLYWTKELGWLDYTKGPILIIVTFSLGFFDLFGFWFWFFFLILFYHLDCLSWSLVTYLHWSKFWVILPKARSLAFLLLSIFHAWLQKWIFHMKDLVLHFKEHLFSNYFAGLFYNFNILHNSNSIFKFIFQISEIFLFQINWLFFKQDDEEK